ncbi:MAG: AAA family ATPase, partial [Roseovarius sp.]
MDADDYHTWIKVLGALYEKGDHMLRVAEEWSATSAKYRAGEVAQRWRTFKPSNGNVWNSVCRMAEANGADLKAIAREHKAVASSAPNKSKDTVNDARSEGSAKIAEQIDSFKAGIFRACDLDGQPVPERVWHVHDLIPANTVTLLSGDGGTGKSLCALQLAVSTALQRPWLGLAVRHGKAVYLSAEDDKAELHRRLADITRAENATLADLGDLTLRSLAGEDALLATVAKGGTLQATPLLEAVEQLLQHDCPDLLVLDTLADYFPGDENNRAQARQFVGLLRGLAINHRCAVVMLAHPSLHGIASGTGTSGSTGWNNSVRSRLYLSRILDKGYEQNPDARVLSVMKSNYSGIGREIALTWQNGVFVADAPVTGLDRMAAIAKAERVFLSLLRLFTEQGRNVNHAGGPNYAPSLFAEHPEREGMTKRVLKTAMDSLLR